MVPALRILVPGSLDTDVAVGDEQLDVAAASFEVVVDRVILILADIVEDVEEVALVLGDGVDESAGEHFIGAALAGHYFTGIVVAETYVIRDFDASLQCRDESWEELGGIEVWCLDEEGGSSIANAREPGFILGDKDVSIVGLSVGGTGDECDWERGGSRNGNVRCKLSAVGNLWRRWANGFGTC